MNRRQFFSFAAVAPVVLPMTVTARTAKPLSVKLSIDTTEFMADLRALNDAGQRGWMSPNEARRVLGLDPVEWFESKDTIADVRVSEQLDCQGDGTQEPERDALS